MTAAAADEHRGPADDDHPSDDALITRAKAGDREAWSTLCRRHARPLAAYLGGRIRRPAVVERLLANTIIQGWRHLQEFAQPGDFPAWFRRLGGISAMAWAREHPDDPVMEPFPDGRCPDGSTQLERMRRLETALGELPERHRRVLEQRFRGGMDPAQIAAALRLPTGEIARAIDEALAALDRALGDPPT